MRKFAVLYKGDIQNNFYLSASEESKAEKRICSSAIYRTCRSGFQTAMYKTVTQI